MPRPLIFAIVTAVAVTPVTFADERQTAPADREKPAKSSGGSDKPSLSRKKDKAWADSLLAWELRKCKIQNQVDEQLCRNRNPVDPDDRFSEGRLKDCIENAAQSYFACEREARGITN